MNLPINSLIYNLTPIHFMLMTKMSAIHIWIITFRWRNKDAESYCKWQREFFFSTFDKETPISGTSWDFTGSVLALTSLWELRTLHLSLPFKGSCAPQEVCQETCIHCKDYARLTGWLVFSRKSHQTLLKCSLLIPSDKNYGSGRLGLLGDCSAVSVICCGAW